MSATRTIVAVAAVVVVAAGVGAFFALRSGGDAVSSGGPLVAPKDGYFSASIPIDVGKPASFGLLVVANKQREPITLERVELVEPTPGLRLVGSYAQPTGSGLGVGLLSGFPPSGAGPNRHDVAGYALAHGAEARIVVGVASARTGSFDAKALRLYYRAKGKQYRDDWPFAVRVCSPAKPWAGRCHAPTG